MLTTIEEEKEAIKQLSAHAERQQNIMGNERFTITEKRPVKRQDGTWYFAEFRIENGGFNVK